MWPASQKELPTPALQLSTLYANVTLIKQDVHLDADVLWEVVVLFTWRLHQTESKLNLFFVLGASELVAVSAGVNARSLEIQ